MYQFPIRSCTPQAPEECNWQPRGKVIVPMTKVYPFRRAKGWKNIGTNCLATAPHISGDIPQRKVAQITNQLHAPSADHVQARDPVTTGVCTVQMSINRNHCNKRCPTSMTFHIYRPAHSSLVRGTLGRSESFLTKKTLNTYEESRRVRLEGKTEDFGSRSVRLYKV